MTQSTTENEHTVSEVVNDLMGEQVDQVDLADTVSPADTVDPAVPAEPPSLEAQVRRAAKEIDARTAESYCRVLLAHLAENAQSLQELDALMILGLAHPSVFEAHRIPFAQEGRRLANLLEQDGNSKRAQALLEAIMALSPGDRQIDHELASMMRRTGNADRLIERYMRRAEEAVVSGKTKEAISWLQEILLVDRSRRDVARMIRDLRWGDQEKRVKWRSRIRMSAAILSLIIVAVLVYQRERDVDERYAAVPEAVSGDLRSLHTRLDELDRLEQENPFSLHLFQASKERARLKVEIALLEAQRAQAAMALKNERDAQLAIAESARKQGRIYAQQNRFPEALEEFERALADGPSQWDQRKQVQIDVNAIREWIATHGTAPIGSSH